MSDQPKSCSSLNLAPLVLRLGVATVLGLYGVSQLRGTAAPTDVAAVSEAARSALASGASHHSLAGLGALAAATMFGFGLFTRFASIALLGTIGYCAYRATAGADGFVLVNSPAGLFEFHRTTMVLLGTSALSLLISGSGCVGLDRLFFGRRKPASSAH
jgi:uncharacterized membrane protein YphA (DoxX/SURF4 family)